MPQWVALPPNRKNVPGSSPSFLQLPHNPKTMQVSWIGTTKLSASVNMNACKSVFLKAWQYLIFRVLLYFHGVFSIDHWWTHTVYSHYLLDFFFSSTQITHTWCCPRHQLNLLKLQWNVNKEVYFSFSHIMDWPSIQGVFPSLGR